MLAKTNENNIIYDTNSSSSFEVSDKSREKEIQTLKSSFPFVPSSIIERWLDEGKSSQWVKNTLGSQEKFMKMYLVSKLTKERERQEKDLRKKIIAAKHESNSKIRMVDIGLKKISITPSQKQQSMARQKQEEIIMRKEKLKLLQEIFPHVDSIFINQWIKREKSIRWIANTLKSQEVEVRRCTKVEEEKRDPSSIVGRTVSVDHGSTKLPLPPRRRPDLQRRDASFITVEVPSCNDKAETKKRSHNKKPLQHRRHSGKVISINLPPGFDENLPPPPPLHHNLPRRESSFFTVGPNAIDPLTSDLEAVCKIFPLVEKKTLIKRLRTSTLQDVVSEQLKLHNNSTRHLSSPLLSSSKKKNSSFLQKKKGKDAQIHNEKKTIVPSKTIFSSSEVFLPLSNKKYESLKRNKSMQSNIYQSSVQWEGNTKNVLKNNDLEIILQVFPMANARNILNMLLDEIPVPTIIALLGRGES